MLNWGVIGLGRIAQRFCDSLSHFDEAFMQGLLVIQKKDDNLKNSIIQKNSMMTISNYLKMRM